MHTSGLILTLDDPQIIGRFSTGPLTLGEPVGRCVPGVLEVADPGVAHDWHDWAAALPGVGGIEVVFVHWDDAEEVSHAGV